MVRSFGAKRFRCAVNRLTVGWSTERLDLEDIDDSMRV